MMLETEGKMQQYLMGNLSAKLVGNRSASASRIAGTSLSIADFSKWWKTIDPLHKAMIIAGVVIALAGLLDLISLLLLKVSIAFWANDILLMFGGFILIQIGLSYVIRNMK